MAKSCVFDLEADGLLDEATRVWCGVFKDIETGEVHQFTDIADIIDFMDSCDTAIAHNGVGYDWPLLKKLYGYEYTGKKVDTLLMSRLQDPKRKRPFGCTSGPHSVEAWGYRFGRKKPEHEDWSQYSPEMMHRCTEDVEIQHRIYTSLLDEGRHGAWAPAHGLTAKVFEILQLQEEYGWLVDQEYMDKCLHQLTHWIDRIDKVVTPHLPRRCTQDGGEFKAPFKKDGGYKHFVTAWHVRSDCSWDIRCIRGPFSRVCFKRVDLGSVAQVKEYLLEQGWRPAQWNEKDGQRTSPKLSQDDPFDGVQTWTGKLIAKRVQCRHRRSQIEGWKKLIRKDGRIAARVTGIAATGRMIHGGIVNVPGAGAFYGKQMRKIFTSKQGYKIVGVDSAGCQNRMLAARVNDPQFTRILLEGNKEDKTSIHYVNMKAIKKASGLDVPYKISKNLNYAFMFGAQDPKLASTAGVAQRFGPLIRKGLLSVSPGFERLIADITAEWKKTARVEMKWGKPRYSHGTITGLDGRPIMIEKEHTLLVFLLQSDEAILMQYALCFLYKWLNEKGWTHGKEYGFVANIHDELQAEVRDDLAEEFAALGRKAITHAGEFLKINCPHQGESDIGTTWYETH